MCDYVMPVGGRDRAVQPQVGDFGHAGLQQVVLHNVHHRFELAKDQGSMLSDHPFVVAVLNPDPALVQKLLKGG